MRRGEDDQYSGDEPEERGGYLTRPEAKPLVVRGGRDVAAFNSQAGGDRGGGAAEINLLVYWQMLLKHRLVIAGAVVAAVALGLAVTLLTTPVYRATTTIQIDREPSKVVDIQSLEDTKGGDAEFFQTQYALLKSRSLAKRVVEREKLADDAEFMGQQRASPLTALAKVLGRGGEPEVSAATTRASNQRAVRLLSEGLTVDPVRGSRLVRIGYDSPDPEVASRIANAMAQNYIGATLDRRFEASSYARTFLEERLAQIKAKLEESERQLVQYASAQQIVSVSGAPTAGGATETAAQSLTASDLVAMNGSLAVATSERIRAEQRWRQAQTSGMNLPEILASPTVQSLRQKQAELQAQYQEKLSVYKPDFPAMVQLKGQIDTIDSQIKAEVDTVKQSIYAQYQLALRQEASLGGRVSGLKSGVMDLRNRAIQYNILQRDVDTNRALYDGLLQRYKEIGVAGGIGANNVSIVDIAEPPRSPYKPNLLLNLAIAAGIGLLIGLAVAFVLESLDETIKMPEDIEGKLGLPLLGSIPVLEKGVTPEEALSDPRSPFSEAYYSVRTALQFSTAEGVPRSLFVTSARPSEGKSTTAVALARNFAKLGLSVLLIDGDLRNPSLHRAMRCDNSSGLSNYLTGTAKLSELVQVTDQPNLGFIPCGPLPPNPAELLAGARIRALAADTVAIFDLLIIDGPPVMGLADAPLLASALEGTILVVEAGTTRRGLAKLALDRLRLGNARILGALLSKFSFKTAGYGYGYGYGYAYNYDYGAPKITHKDG